MSRFRGWNARLSDWIEPRLPHVLKTDTLPPYLEAVRSRVGDGPVLDVGGGRKCIYAPIAGSLIALDVSESELRLNRDGDSRVVADASISLPFKDGSVGLITAWSVLEHLPRVEPFIAEAARVLQPGGALVVRCPGRNGISALVNRFLGHRLAERLLFAIRPELRGECGFPAYYDHMTASALEALLYRNGFKVKTLIGYHSASYLRVFTPAFLAVAAYEMLVWALRLRDLAPAFLIVAERTT